MKTKILLPALALVFAGAVAWASVPRVAAQTTSGKTIIQRLAEKFGVNQSDVQSVFDTQRAEHQTEMQMRFEERLTAAVKADKITEAQKSAILKKHQEMQTEREQERTQWQAWLKANNLENVDLGFGFGGKGMGMGRGMHGW